MITSCAPMPFMRSNSPSPSRSSVPSTRSAGNLFGTTRTSQPLALACVPLRYARISGGVLSSCPSQNGQSSSGLVVTVSIWKSLGRFWRSVEMMTQRPVTGSFRKSAMKIECVLHHFHCEAAGARCRHADDVEAARRVREPFLAQVCRSHAAQAVPFLPGHRVERIAETATRTRADLHEDKNGAVARDDVQLAASRAKAAIENR